MRQNPIHLISVNINKLNVSWICLWVLSVVWRFSGNRNKKNVRMYDKFGMQSSLLLFVCLFVVLQSIVLRFSYISNSRLQFFFLWLTHFMRSALTSVVHYCAKGFFLPIFCALWAVTLWQVAKCTILLCFYVILLFVVGRFFSRVSESCFAWFFWHAFLPLCTYRRAIMLSWNCVLNCINPNHLRG